MVATYSLFGRQIGSHYLAIATLTVTFGGSFLATRGGSSAKAQETPPLNASSKDEEAFIKEFLASVEDEGKKAKA